MLRERGSFAVVSWRGRREVFKPLRRHARSNIAGEFTARREVFKPLRRSRARSNIAGEFTASHLSPPCSGGYRPPLSASCRAMSAAISASATAPVRNSLWLPGRRDGSGGRSSGSATAMTRSGGARPSTRTATSSPCAPLNQLSPTSEGFRASLRGAGTAFATEYSPGRDSAVRSVVTGTVSSRYSAKS